MFVLENFKDIPRSPYGGRQGSNVIFFFKFATKSLEKKKEGACRPPQRATGPCRPPQGRQGPVARWGGATGSNPWPQKIQEKRHR